MAIDSYQRDPPIAQAKRTRLGREYLIVLAAALILYGVSVAPGPVWQDNGAAQVRVLRHDLRGEQGLALSHPLYYLVAFAFQLLPFGEPALRTNLVSVVCGAVTVANVFLLLRMLTDRRAAAIVGTISLAVAHTFWQHCALPETYTLTSALLAGELLCLARYVQTGRQRWIIFLFLTSGMGLSNHMIAVLNLPVWGSLLLWLLWRRKIGAGTLLGAGLAWLGGASVYLGLIVSELAAGEPAGNVIGSALFGGHYAGNVLNLHVGASLLRKSCLYLGLNFPTPVALLALVGLAAVRRGEPRLVLRALAAALVIHLLWAVRYDIVDQYTFFIPSVVLIAVFIGIGADRFLRSHRRAWVWVLPALALLPPVIYAPLPWIVRAAGLRLGVKRDIPYRDSYSYFLWPWKTGHHGPTRFANAVQQTLPDGAFLIADSTTAPPIHYQMETGRWKKSGTVWPPPHGIGGELEPAAEDAAEALREGLVYVVTPQPGYCPAWLLSGYKFERESVLYHVVANPPTTRSVLEGD